MPLAPLAHESAATAFTFDRAPSFGASAIRRYASGLGLAFQIRDDMLDVIGDEATFGKPIGSDVSEGKTTFADLLGIDGCAREVARLTDAAIDALRGVEDADFLIALARALTDRKK